MGEPEGEGRASAQVSDAELDDTCEAEEPPSSRRIAAHGEVAYSSPGTLNIKGDTPPEIHLIDFNATTFVEKRLASLDEAEAYLADHHDTVTWLDVRGIQHRPTFERIGQMFKIHPLALEDIVNVPQRPKSDEYPDQQLIVTRMVTLDEGGDLVTEQLSILFGKGFVLTVQEEPAIDCLDPLRARIRSGKGSLRTSGADYLAYALTDAVIDGFYPVLERVGEKLEELELQVSDLDRPTGTSTAIFQMKRDLLTLRRAVWPQRDLLSSLLRDASTHIHPDTRVYLRDTYDHAVQVMDMVETFREIASGLMDLYMTGISHRLNEVMKVLTILSTIFLPMTFVAGVYGMNFDPSVSPLNMPELRWYFGYPLSLLLMSASAGGLLFYYKRKGWIGAKGSWSPSKRRSRSGPPRLGAKVKPASRASIPGKR